MVCAPVRKDNPRAIDRTGAQTMLYLSLVFCTSSDDAMLYICIIDIIQIFVKIFHRLL